MKRVKYTGNIPEYIDSFPKGCERSCKGSLHLLPNALKDITDGEYEYIKKKYPKMRLMVVPKEKPAIKRVKPTEAQKFHAASKPGEQSAKPMKKALVKKGKKD